MQIMKLQTTKKQIRENFYNILSIGYCSADSLLQHVRPFAYSAGVYGWSCDYYDIDGVCISTGYSPIGTDTDYNLLKEFENAAQKINSNYELNYTERKEATNKLLHDFIAKQLERTKK